MFVAAQPRLEPTSAGAIMSRAAESQSVRRPKHETHLTV
jgi:hypothetical protein